MGCVGVNEKPRVKIVPLQGKPQNPVASGGYISRRLRAKSVRRTDR
jgi:hypothetical protein